MVSPTHPLIEEAPAGQEAHSRTTSSRQNEGGSSGVLSCSEATVSRPGARRRAGEPTPFFRSSAGRSDMEALQRELQVLSEQYSQKCLEIGALTRQAEEREHTLRRCQQEGQELLRHNQVGLAPGWEGTAPTGPPAALH